MSSSTLALALALAALTLQGYVTQRSTSPFRKKQRLLAAVHVRWGGSAGLTSVWGGSVVQSRSFQWLV